MKVEFRLARIEDSNSIQNIAFESWRRTYSNQYTFCEISGWVAYSYDLKVLKEHIRSTLDDPNYHFEVAVIDGQVVGFSEIKLEPPSARLMRIYVLPDMIKNKIGSTLFAHGEEFVTRAGCNAITLRVNNKNEQGMSFCRSRDFQVVDNDEEEILFKKQF